MFATLILMASLPAAAAPDTGGPMGTFTLTPKLGYAYLGNQAVWANGDVNGQPGINALQVMLNLTFGRESTFELGPLYMYETVAGRDSALNAPGVYLGWTHTWRMDSEKAGVWYPGIGFGWGTAFPFGGYVSWGITSYLRIPVSVSWYPSKTTPVAVTLEASVGGVTTNLFFENGSSYALGVYSDVLVGVRFF